MCGQPCPDPGEVFIRVDQPEVACGMSVHSATDLVPPCGINPGLITVFVQAEQTPLDHGHALVGSERE